MTTPPPSPPASIKDMDVHKEHAQHSEYSPLLSSKREPYDTIVRVSNLSDIDYEALSNKKKRFRWGRCCFIASILLVIAGCISVTLSYFVIIPTIIQERFASSSGMEVKRFEILNMDDDGMDARIVGRLPMDSAYKLGFRVGSATYRIFAEQKSTSNRVRILDMTLPEISGITGSDVHFDDRTRIDNVNAAGVIKMYQNGSGSVDMSDYRFVLKASVRISLWNGFLTWNSISLESRKEIPTVALNYKQYNATIRMDEADDEDDSKVPLIASYINPHPILIPSPLFNFQSSVYYNGTEIVQSLFPNVSITGNGEKSAELPRNEQKVSMWFAPDGRPESYDLLVEFGRLYQRGETLNVTVRNMRLSSVFDPSQPANISWLNSILSSIEYCMTVPKIQLG